MNERLRGHGRCHLDYGDDYTNASMIASRTHPIVTAFSRRLRPIPSL